MPNEKIQLLNFKGHAPKLRDTVTEAANGRVLTWDATEKSWYPGEGGASSAPVGAEYVVLAVNASLTNERVLTGGSGITLTDGGAGSTITITIGSGAVSNAMLADSAITISTGDGLTGGGSVSLGSSSGAITVSVDGSTLFFHWEYLDQSLQAGSSTGPPGVGVYTVLISDDADQLRVGADIDALFENGPQRVQSSPEAEFNAQFVSMVGNVPFFVGAIGTGVLVAILLATLNTMLMAGREQTKDVGVLKALGFGSGATFWMMLSQSLLLCGVGAGGGILLALGASDSLRGFLGTTFPGFSINSEIIQTALSLALGVALFAGLAPAVRARSLRVVDALREEI